MLNTKGKALVLHGGGLVDCSSWVLMRFAKNLSRIFEEVYIGKYSFESLYQKAFWFKYDNNLVDFVKDKRGTFFGTCRDVFIEGEKLQRAIKLLKENNVTTIVICGGDGSSRQVNEMYEAFKKEGINIIFPIPLTIDGINGGEAIGIKQAVKESIRQIENMVATSLETRDREAFGVVVVEIQGRNRDDIMAKILKRFDLEGKVADYALENLLLVVLPNNEQNGKTTDIENFYETVNSSTKRTLILRSEACQITMSDLKKKIKRKVRTLIIGHQSQSNNQTTAYEVAEINKWVDEAYYLMTMCSKKIFCISKDEFGMLEVQPISYYAKLNPRENQRCVLSQEEQDLLCEYMIT